MDVQPARHEAICHATHLGGHHGAHIALFRQLFGMAASVGRVNAKNIFRLVRAERLFFVTLDDDVLGFVVVAITRSLLGCPTAGQFLRPQSCFLSGFRGRCKRLLFRTLRMVPNVSTLSLLPFDAMPELKQVATFDLHDPQLWDVVDNHPLTDGEFATELKRLADGRPILVFLGTVTIGKGFAFLAELIEARPNLARDLCVIVAGQVKPECHAAAERAARSGAIIWDRRIADGELEALYDASDAVWVCYHPDYDQASGIFGRAVQYGAVPVIRDGAKIVGHYTEMLGIDAIRLPENALVAADLLVSRMKTPLVSKVASPDTLRTWREHFMERVNMATVRTTGAPRQGKSI